jgi:site-specific DNA recombinase
MRKHQAIRRPQPANTTNHPPSTSNHPVDGGAKLNNLFATVADVIELDASLRSEIARLQEQKGQIDKLINAKARKLHEPFAEVSADKAALFAAAVQTKLFGTSNPAFAKAYLKVMVSRVDVSISEVNLYGTETAHGRQVIDHYPTKLSFLTFEQHWCTRLDSNQWPTPSEGVTLSS